MTIGRWRYVSKSEVTVKTDTISITGLNGQASEEYLFEIHIIHGDPGTSYDFQFRPNAVTTNLASAYRWNSTTVTNTTWEIVGTAQDIISVELELSAAINPRAAAVNHPRSARWRGMFGNTPADSSNIRVVVGAGIWTETSTKLTSAEIVSCTSGTNTKNAQIDVGSVVAWYRRAN